MKKRITAAVLALLLALCLLPCIAAADASGDMNVSFRRETFEIDSQTEDFTLSENGSETLEVRTSWYIGSYRWDVSADGGSSWTLGTVVNTASATNAAAYELTDAQANTPEATAYQYRATVWTEADGQGDTASTVISVLVSDQYSYRTISLRNGDTDVASYMHDKTRLVVTPLPDSNPAAVEMAKSLEDSCVPLLICDISLVNQDNQVVPYFGRLRIMFDVGPEYEGETLRVFHYKNDATDVYTGEVVGGVLSIVVDSLSPFMIEVPAVGTHAVTVTGGTGGSVTPSGKINVKDGSDRTVTLLPDEGYEIGAVTVGGETVSVTGNTLTLSNIAANQTVSVSFRQVSPSEEVHTVTINRPARGSVYPSGSIQVKHGAAQTIYFYPDSGYELEEVLVNGVPVNVIGNSFTLSAVTEDTEVRTSFRMGQTQQPNVYRDIAASTGAHGAISPMGDVRVEYGGDMYFYFIPDEGYEVDQVYIDGEAAGASDSYHFVNVIDAHEIRVTFKETVIPPQPTYRTVTASAGANGSISPDGATQVSVGGSQAFSFVPDQGYEVDTVTVDGTPVTVSGSSYTLTDVSEDSTIRVTFRKIYHTVTASAGAHGSISPSGSVQIAAGGSQTFRFLPKSNYAVDTVTVDGARVSVTGNAYTFSDVSAAHTVHVTFKRTSAYDDSTVYYSITAGADGRGRISPAGTVWVEEGYGQTFSFIPDEGYTLDTVTVDGVTVTGTDTSYRFADVRENHTIRASFRKLDASAEPTDHVITASSGEHGSISPDGEIRVAAGGNAWFYFIPNDGYAVDTVTVDGAAVETADGSQCFEAVEADHSIHVTFKQAGTAGAAPFHTVTVTAEGNGSFSPSGDIQVADGSAQTFYFIPDEGYEVAAIYVNGVEQAVVGDQFTLDNVTGDVELRVRFQPSEAAKPHCFLCQWIGRDIAPWCWLVPVILLLVLCGAAWGILSKRRR